MWPQLWAWRWPKWFSSLFLRIYRYSTFSRELGQTLASSPVLPPILTEVDIRKQYETKAMSKFMFEATVANRNANMTPLMYNRAEFKKVMNTGGNIANEVERIWRNRTLHEYTPAGGVLMFYDAFKEGFTYRSDTTTISYTILNAVAMKYVGIFKCRDLFVDTTLEFTNKSPLATAFEDELCLENKKKRDLVNQMANTIVTQATSPFANFRSYNKTTGLVPTMTNLVSSVEICNRFIYAGRMSGIAEKSKQISREPKLIGYAAFKLQATKSRVSA